MAWKDLLAAELRDARGAESQAEVAARSGVSDRTIGLIEQQKLKTKPRPDTVVRLALATGRDPGQWLGHLGLVMSDESIDRIRAQVRTITRLDRLKDPDEIARELIADIERLMRTKLPEAGKKLEQFVPAEDLRQQLKDYVHTHVETAMSTVEPAQKLRREITAYVDARLDNVEKILGDIVRRIDHLQTNNLRTTLSSRRPKGRKS